MRWNIHKSLAVVCLTLVFGHVAESAEQMPVSVIINADDVACDRFRGFGVEWDSRGYDAAGVTDEDFAVIRKRVEWMRFPVVRIMMRSEWCCKKGKYEWESPEMRALYRHLDLCQQMGTTVFLTEWRWKNEDRDVREVGDLLDPKLAEIIGTYLDYLVNKRGYDCIKYFIMGNEPNGRGGDWGRWKKSVEDVFAELRKRDLTKKIVFTGPDQVYNDKWHYMAVDQLQHILGAYDVHRYLDGWEVRAGHVYDYYSRLWQYALDNDPKARNKPFVITEAGSWRPRAPRKNPLHLDYDYGVLMADYAVQAANAGSSAVLAWMLDDNSHPKFTWGMWHNKANGLALKPWFYPWSLLCRYFRSGSIILKSEHTSKGVRVLVARYDREKKRGGHWSFCVVNNSDAPAKVLLRVPDDSMLSMQRFVYRKDSAKADVNGFPLPLDTRVYDLSQEVVIDCAVNSVVVLTAARD